MIGKKSNLPFRTLWLVVLSFYKLLAEEPWLLPKKCIKEIGVRLIVFDICHKRAVNVIDRGHYFERWLRGIYILYAVELWLIRNLI